MLLALPASAEYRISQSSDTSLRERVDAIDISVGGILRGRQKVEGIQFYDGTRMTSAGVTAGTVTVQSPITGTGSSGNPIGLATAMSGDTSGNYPSPSVIHTQLGAVDFSTITASIFTNSALFQPNKNRGILIPLYIYPDGGSTNSTYTYVASIVAKYPQVPFTIVINPGNGPGANADGWYTNAIGLLQQNGATVLGYVYSSFGARPIQQIYDDIKTYTTFYPMINGIFVDEVDNHASPDLSNYYLLISSYAHNLNLYPVIDNPGTQQQDIYFNIKAADNQTIWETSTYPSSTTICGGPGSGGYEAASNYWSRSVIVHTQTSYSSAAAHLALQCANMLFVTDGGVSPYTSIYTHVSSFLDKMAADINTYYYAYTASGDKFVVNKSSFGVNVSTPMLNLDVNGAAQIGSTRKSTFTATGEIVSPSSITASAFFGDGSNLTGLVASVVNTAAVQTDAITSVKVINGAITTGKLATDSVSSASILNGSIQTQALASDSVTAVKIINSAVQTAKHATDSVTAAAILNATITNAKLAANTIDSTRIAAGGVDTNALGSGAVNTTKLLTDAITSAAILNGAVQTGKLSTDAVTASAILNATITAAKLASNSVSNAKIVDAAVQTSKMDTNGDFYWHSQSLGAVSVAGGGNTLSVTGHTLITNGNLTSNSNSNPTFTFNDTTGTGQPLIQFQANGSQAGYLRQQNYASTANNLLAIVEPFNNATASMTADNIVLAPYSNSQAVVTVTGRLTSNSSITASGFFGDGSHLTGISAGLVGGVLNKHAVWGSATTLNPGSLTDDGLSLGTTLPFTLSGSSLTTGGNASFGAAASTITFGATPSSISFITNGIGTVEIRCSSCAIQISTAIGSPPAISLSTANAVFIGTEAAAMGTIASRLYGSTSADFSLFVGGGLGNQRAKLGLVSATQSILWLGGSNSLALDFYMSTGAYLNPQGIGTNTTLGLIRWRPIIETGVQANLAQISAATQNGGVDHGSYPTFMAFQTTSPGAVAASEKVRLTSTGTLAIGLNNPTARHLETSTVQTDVANSTNVWFRGGLSGLNNPSFSHTTVAIQNNMSNGNTGCSSCTNVALYIDNQNDLVSSSGFYGTGRLIWAKARYSTVTSDMVLNGYGLLGLGNAWPVAKLHISSGTSSGPGGSDIATDMSLLIDGNAGIPFKIGAGTLTVSNVAGSIAAFDFAGSSFTVGGSTFNITDGNVGVSSTTPKSTFVVGSTQTFIVDSAGHTYSGGSAPSISSCGSTPNGSVVGTDSAGTITIGGGVVTACTLTFANPYTSQPSCVITDNSTTIPGDISSISNTAFTTSFSASLGGGKVYYICMGVR